MPFGKFEKLSSFIYWFICIFSTSSSFSCPSRTQSELFCYDATVPNVLSGFVFRSIFSLFSLGDFYWSTFSSLILSSVSSVFLSQSIKDFYFCSFFQQSHLPGWSAGPLGVVSLGTNWSPRDLSSCSRSQGPACLVRCWEGRPDAGQATPAPEPSGRSEGTGNTQTRRLRTPLLFSGLWSPAVASAFHTGLRRVVMPVEPAQPRPTLLCFPRRRPATGPVLGVGVRPLTACSAQFFSMLSPFSMQGLPVMMVTHTAVVTAPTRPADMVPGVLGEPARVPPGRVHGHFPLLWMRKHTHRLCGGLTWAHVLARAQDRTGRV